MHSDYSGIVIAVLFVLPLFVWPVMVALLHATLPWTFGPEAASAWQGRRRLKMLATVFAVSAGVTILLRASQAPGPFFNHILMLNPVSVFVGLAGDPLHQRYFVELLSKIGFFELGLALLLLMGVKLYEKWVNGRTSPAERQTGLAGVRAWLSPPNVLWVAVVALCGFGALSGGFIGEPALLLLGLLVPALVVVIATPVWLTLRAQLERARRATQPPAPAAMATASNDLSHERQRVLRLLEDGRLTADEASELLVALAATAAPATPAGVPLTLPRKLTLVGAAVVLVGFFIPWFVINPAAEMQRMTGIDTASINGGFPSEMFSQMRVNGQPVPMPTPGRAAVITISGGDVARGMGWIVLATAVLTAAAPAVSGLTPPARRQAAWLAAGVGTVIGLYLLTGSWRAVSFGLVVVLIGQAAQWTGLLLDMPAKPRATPLLSPTAA